MSTKKLSRTVIEGGRHSYNKWERRHTHAEVRAEERDYLKQVMADPDLADEIDVDEGRPIPKEFTDKLRPMYRWLEAQVGRPWSEVRSEVFTKFDTRTTAGRHITFDHLLREVVDTESGFDNRGRIADPTIPLDHSEVPPYRWRGAVSDYYVDKDGVLCAREDIHHRLRHRLRYAFVSEQEYKDAEAWLNGRMIGEKGGKLYWFVATERIWRASWHNLDKPYETFNFYNGLQYFIVENGLYDLVSPSSMIGYPSSMTCKIHGDHWVAVKNPFSFRQRGELTVEEIKAFKVFKEKIRDDILKASEGR